MKNLTISLIIGISLLLTTCKGDDDPGASDAVLIRVKNTSSYNYTDVFVNTSGGQWNYGDITSNKASEYRAFDYAYHYAFVSLKINGQTFMLQPYDYVGASKLESGYYTYEIGANKDGDQYSRLSLTFNKD